MRRVGWAAVRRLRDVSRTTHRKHARRRVRLAEAFIEDDPVHHQSGGDDCRKEQQSIHVRAACHRVGGIADMMRRLPRPTRAESS